MMEKPSVALEPAFPEWEYSDRIARVRERIGELGLDVLLVTYLPHLCYLTGFQTPVQDGFNCLTLPLDQDPVMLLSDFEAHGAPLHCRAARVVTHSQDDGPRKLVEIVTELGLSRKRVGAELGREGLTPAAYERLLSALPAAKFLDATGILAELRVIKSPLELEHIRQAARMSDAGMSAALNATRSGVTDNDIAAAAQEAMIRAGSEYFSAEPFIIVGRRAGLNHAMYKRIPVSRGDAMTFELAAAYHRYGAPVERTAVIGAPSDAIKRLADFSYNAICTLIDNVRPGRPIAELARVVNKVLLPLKDEIYPRTQFGYSVGLDFPPDWGEEHFLVHEGNPRQLEPGMVFHSPQSIRVPGRHGACISELWAVTDTGVEVFSKLPREVTVIPA